MKKVCAAFIALLVCFALLSQTVLACTIFCATDGVKMLVGNNEDWTDKDSFIWFLPAANGEFGRMCFGFEEAQPQGGMNEKGFFFDIVAYSEPKQAPNPEGKPGYPHNKGDMLLGQCATVDDALALIAQYSPAEYGYIEMFLADKSGASATVKWDWAGSKMIVQKTEGRYRAIGYGKDAVTPMLETEAITVDNFRGMLDAAHQGDLTVYSNIYDPIAGDVYIYNQHNYGQFVHYNLARELAKGKHIRYIPGLFPDQKPGIYDEVKRTRFFGPGALELMVVFAALFLFAVCFWLWQIIARRRALKLALWCYAVGIAGSAATVAVMLLTLLQGPYVVAYGYALFGPVVAALPWAQLALAAAQVVCSVLLWIRKDIRIPGKILYTVVTLVSTFLFVMMSLPGMK